MLLPCDLPACLVMPCCCHRSSFDHAPRGRHLCRSIASAHTRPEQPPHRPIHRINHERSRYVYELHYKKKEISRELLDFCIREKVVDGNLIAKWKKPGYEFLCSVAAINKGSTNFGTTSVCRVPLRLRSGKIGPSAETGCISCASCDKGAPIWWNSTVPDAGAKRGADEEVDDEIERRAAALRGDFGGSSDSKRARTDD
jgi:bud site selection protein 31